VGVKEVSEKVWLVTFMHYDLGSFDQEFGRVDCAENPFGAEVSPTGSKKQSGVVLRALENSGDRAGRPSADSGSKAIGWPGYSEARLKPEVASPCHAANREARARDGRSTEFTFHVLRSLGCWPFESRSATLRRCVRWGRHIGASSRPHGRLGFGHAGRGCHRAGET
jgi:hypothetical protein